MSPGAKIVEFGCDGRCFASAATVGVSLVRKAKDGALLPVLVTVDYLALMTNASFSVD